MFSSPKFLALERSAIANPIHQSDIAILSDKGLAMERRSGPPDEGLNENTINPSRWEMGRYVTRQSEDSHSFVPDGRNTMTHSPDDNVYEVGTCLPLQGNKDCLYGRIIKTLPGLLLDKRPTDVTCLPGVHHELGSIRACFFGRVPYLLRLISLEEYQRSRDRITGSPEALPPDPRSPDDTTLGPLRGLPAVVPFYDTFQPFDQPSSYEPVSEGDFDAPILGGHLHRQESVLFADSLGDILSPPPQSTVEFSTSSVGFNTHDRSGSIRNIDILSPIPIGPSMAPVWGLLRDSVNDTESTQEFMPSYRGRNQADCTSFSTQAPIGTPRSPGYKCVVSNDWPPIPGTLATSWGRQDQHVPFPGQTLREISPCVGATPPTDKPLTAPGGDTPERFYTAQLFSESDDAISSTESSDGGSVLCTPQSMLGARGPLSPLVSSIWAAQCGVYSNTAYGRSKPLPISYLKTNWGLEKDHSRREDVLLNWIKEYQENFYTRVPGPLSPIDRTVEVTDGEEPTSAHSQSDTQPTAAKVYSLLGSPTIRRPPPAQHPTSSNCTNSNSLVSQMIADSPNASKYLKSLNSGFKKEDSIFGSPTGRLRNNNCDLDACDTDEDNPSGPKTAPEPLWQSGSPIRNSPAFEHPLKYGVSYFPPTLSDSDQDEFYLEPPASRFARIFGNVDDGEDNDTSSEDGSETSSSNAQDRFLFERRLLSPKIASLTLGDGDLAVLRSYEPKCHDSMTDTHDNYDNNDFCVNLEEDANDEFFKNFPVCEMSIAMGFHTGMISRRSHPIY